MAALDPRIGRMFRKLAGDAKVGGFRVNVEQAPTDAVKEQAQQVIDGMDDRGAWVEKGRLRHHKVEPKSGIIDCQTFVRNVRTLSRLLTAPKKHETP